MPFQGRRQAQRRGAVQWPPTVPTVGYLTIASSTPPSLGPGDTFQLVVLVQSPEVPNADSVTPARQTLTDRTVTYQSSDAGVASVDAAGLVSYVSAGAATITATCEGVTATQGFTCVSPEAAVATVTVAPTTLALAPGATAVLAAVVRDASTNVLVGRTVTWASDDTGVVTVGADSGDDAHTATVSVVATGSATVTATCETVASNGVATTVSSASVDGAAELPRAYVSVGYSLPAGGIYTVKNAGGDYTPAQFQTCLNDAAANTIKVIVVDNDVTISTTTPFLPPAKAWDDWTYILGASVYADTFPRDDTERVVAADDSVMPLFRTTASNKPVFTFAEGVTHPAKYRLAGLRITSTVTGGGIGAALVSIDGGAVSANQPEDIIVDRCHIYGTPGTNFVRRGVRLDGKRCAVVNSRIEGIVDAANSDSQAVWCLEAVGPTRISNSYLEAASENFMCGGATTSRSPADIHFHHNHCYKPEAWIGVYPVKNLFELKTGVRVLVEACVFENCWNSGQTGSWIVLKSSANQATDGVQYWTRDVVVRDNWAKGCGEWISLSATQANSTQVMTRITFRNNLGSAPRGAATRSTILLGTSATTTVGGLTIEGNTLLSSVAYYTWTVDPGALWSGAKADSIVFDDNIVSSGSLTAGGFIGASGASPGMGNITPQWTSYSVMRNGVIGRKTNGGYDASNIGTGDADHASAQFTDLSGNNFRLGAGSPFKGIGAGGADPGVDQDALDAALTGVV